MIWYKLTIERFDGERAQRPPRWPNDPEFAEPARRVMEVELTEAEVQTIKESLVCNWATKYGEMNK